MSQGVSGMSWYIAIGIITIGVILTLIRALKGPTPADRMVAVDSMTTITTALLVLLGLYFKRYIYLDIALVYAVLAFVATLAVARYMEGGL